MDNTEIYNQENMSNEFILHNIALEKEIRKNKIRTLFFPNKKELIILFLSLFIFSFIIRATLNGGFGTQEFNFYDILYFYFFMFGLIDFSMAGFFHGYSSIWQAQAHQDRIMAQLAKEDGNDYITNINFFNFSLSILCFMISGLANFLS